MSKQPLSIRRLSSELLEVAYADAVKLRLDEAFIQLLRVELERRYALMQVSSAEQNNASQ